MLHADTPGIGPELLPGFHEAGGGERNFVVSDPAKGVVSERLGGGRGVEVYGVGFSRLRDRVGKPGHQIAVGVDDGAAVTGADVLKGEGFEEGGLSRSGLADQVCVKEPVGLSEAERDGGGAGVGAREEGDAGGGAHVPQVIGATNRCQDKKRAIPTPSFSIDNQESTGKPVYSKEARQQ